MLSQMGVFFRLLPTFKGKQMLARFFLKTEIKKAAHLVVKGKFDCTYHLPNLKEMLALEIYINGIYEKDTHQFLKNRIPLNGLFLDLGANIGSITVPLCKQRPDITGICVEAMPWIFNVLQQNIQQNNLGKQIQCINKALLDKDGASLPFYSPADHFGKGSLSPAFTHEAVMVESITVDTLLKELGFQQADMVKIDIEGYEYFAFKGATALLSLPGAPDILFEFIDWAEENAGVEKGAAQNLLMEMGFTLYEIKDAYTSLPLVKPMTKGSAMLLASKK